MVIEHPSFKDPSNPALELWHYIDFTKLLFLLETSSLYFCRADELRKYDPFEGSFPKAEYKALNSISDKKIIINAHKIALTNTFVSCWHLNGTESMAMWHVYSGLGKGVAIKTTIGNFKEAFNETDKDIYAGEVQYINYKTSRYITSYIAPHYRKNVFITYIHKRDIFKYEQEYRAIYSGTKQKEVMVTVNLSALIREIIVAPYTSDWLFDFLTKTCKRFVPDVKVSKSIFEDKPCL